MSDNDRVAHHLEELYQLFSRRLAGDYEVDEFGFDTELTEKFTLPALRPLYRKWFRVETLGIEHVPDKGAALLVGNHSGTIAVDAMMLQLALFDEHPASRHLRLLAADFVFKTPLLGEYARKTGATLASNPDAERLLRAGEVLGVFPEGVKGTGKPVWERYKLKRFGRGGFVSTALATETPIIPVSIVGAEEIYPILGDIPVLARLFGIPYFPITPTFPFLGPLGAVPLPSKWIIQFGEPISTEGMSELADDPMEVFNLADRVKETIQQTLHSLLKQRGGAFQ
ncbi:1-acyl-sn-glycerol-3-phosphate acyltransferase [Stackebrandtia endophytica]|uniref:1-acyl-sn-glycerol-3-phosphate acyltransferase n=1 Tax=Stackebrandtia endophytica TaxID=1496996 RepID=A0A543AYE8_9ACTN|nr:lysophospholipid acyltransferase family protein [Stackebrandtia endophytica]TQL77589.1 1-acyl-sn-glycerol-3-phosphate acyltransferase [Stackebrandtia endophytica]